MNPVKVSEVSRDLLVRYRDRRIDDIVRVSKAFETRDFKTIREVGHRIKGNASLYGLHDLGEAAKDMEEAALAGDLAQISECIARFENEIGRIVRPH